VESSSDGVFRLSWRERQVNSRARTSHKSPSVAVCCFDFISLMTRDWRVSDSAGKADCLSLTFLMFPWMSFLTSENAVEPRISKSLVSGSAALRNSVVEMALFALSTGTSTNDCLTLSKKVPPGGYAAMIAGCL